MNKEILKYTLVQPFREPHVGEEVYLLDVGNEHFGFLYTTPQAMTFGWNGTLDFSHLEEEVYNQLSCYISDGQNRLFPGEGRTREVTSVYLTIQNESSVDFELKNPEDYNKYTQLLKNFDLISFVRYDIHDTAVHIPLIFSFTAENPRWITPVEADDAELTIKLPRSQPWPEELLAWIVQHHSAYAILKDMIDLGEASATLSNFSRALVMN